MSSLWLSNPTLSRWLPAVRDTISRLFASDASEEIAKYVDDPIGFNDHILGRSFRDPDDGLVKPAPYWAKQEEICRSVVHYQTTVVPTGNSVGKSFLSAGLILWWLHTRPGSLVIVTAPSQTLIGNVVWKEIRRALVHTNVPLPGYVSESPRVSPQTIEIDNTGWGALGFATRGLERLAGQHHTNLLVLVDEGSGVESEIWEALDSQNARKLVAFGNPVRPDGRFRELHMRAMREKDDPSIPDAERVHSIRIASTESPDIKKSRSNRGLADQTFLRNSERQYGRNSLWWKSHIEAIFPEVSADTLIPVAWIDACTAVKRRQGMIIPPVRIAVDLAEGTGRDRAVVLVRDQIGILEITQSSTEKPIETAERVFRKTFEWGVAPHRVVFDKGGIIGKDFEKALIARGLLGCTPYTGSMSGGRDFTNLRSMAGWKLRRRLDPDTMIDPPIDQKTGTIPAGMAPSSVKQEQFIIPFADWYPSLREELEALSYSLVGGKTKLALKDEVMETLGRSPDLGDALLMSFAFTN